MVERWDATRSRSIEEEEDASSGRFMRVEKVVDLAEAFPAGGFPALLLIACLRGENVVPVVYYSWRL